MKQFLAALLTIVVLVFLLTSCDSMVIRSLTDRFFSEDYASEKRDLIAKTYGEHRIYGQLLTKMEYQGVVYCRPQKEVIYLAFEDMNDYMALSWSGNRLGYVTVNRSYTTDNPLFIYNESGRSSDYGFFFREDYDYMSDTFQLEGTDFEAPLSLFFDIDALVLDTNDFEAPTNNSSFYPGYVASFTLASKTNATIRSDISFCYVNNEWLLYTGRVYFVHFAPASAELVQILQSYDVLPLETSQ